MSESAAPARSNGVLSIPGCINSAVYYSLARYIMSPKWKLILLGLTIAYDGWLVYQLIVSRNPGYLIFIALFTGVMVFLHIHNQKSVVKRIIRGRKELQGNGFDVLLCFDRSVIRLCNHTTGSERTVPYTDLVSTVETDRCIAYFTRKNNYLMVPKDRMTDTMRTQLLALMKEKCPNLKQRR